MLYLFTLFCSFFLCSLSPTSSLQSHTIPLEAALHWADFSIEELTPEQVSKLRGNLSPKDFYNTLGYWVARHFFVPNKNIQIALLFQKVKTLTRTERDYFLLGMLRCFETLQLSFIRLTLSNKQNTILVFLSLPPDIYLRIVAAYLHKELEIEELKLEKLKISELTADSETPETPTSSDSDMTPPPTPNSLAPPPTPEKSSSSPSLFQRLRRKRAPSASSLSTSSLSPRFSSHSPRLASHPPRSPSVSTPLSFRRSAHKPTPSAPLPLTPGGSPSASPPDSFLKGSPPPHSPAPLHSGLLFLRAETPRSLSPFSATSPSSVTLMNSNTLTYA